MELKSHFCNNTGISIEVQNSIEQLKEILYHLIIKYDPRIAQIWYKDVILYCNFKDMILISVIITLTLSVNKMQQNVSKQSLMHSLNWKH